MKISIKNTFLITVREVLRNQKFILLFWGVNVIAAFLLSIPIYQMLIESLNHSLISNKLANGFDYSWYVQFVSLFKNGVSQLPLTLYGVVLVYTLLNAFFMGGLISIFNFPKKNHMVDFFYGCVKYWLRFIKVLIITLLLFAIAFKINDYLGDLISWMFSNTEYVLTEFILRALRYVFLVFLIGIVTMISDYTKVVIVVKNRTKILKAVSEAIAFLKKDFQKIFTIFFLVAVLGAVGALLYNVFGLTISRLPYYFLLLPFILQQMLIIFRLNIRMLFCSTEVILYKDLSAEIIKPLVEEEKIGV